MNLAGVLATILLAGVATTWTRADATEFVYVTAPLDDAVMVIDASTDTVLTSVPVADSPIGIAADAVGGRVYVGSTGTGSVSVISIATNAVIGTISVGSSPMAMAFNPAKRRLYVADSEGIAVIDAATQSVVDRIADVKAAGYCDSVAVNHAGDRLYVVGQGQDGGRIWVIDTSNDEIVRAIPIFDHPCSATVAPDDSVVYVTPGDALYSYLAMLRLHASDNSVDSLLIGGNGWDNSLALSEDGTLMYMRAGVELLRIFNLTNGELQGYTALAPSPLNPSYPYAYGMAFGSPSGKLYVADSASNTVSVVDTIQQKYLHAVTVGYFPNGLAIVSIGDSLYANGFEAVAGTTNQLRTITKWASQ